MAEERFIDTDKDKKYKIRKNADGEDELVIDDSQTADEEDDIPVFNIPVYEEEEPESLSPDELAEYDRLKKEEEKALKEKFLSLLERGREEYERGDFEAALYSLSQANEIADENGEFFCLYLKTLTRNFTDFLSLEKCAAVADGVRDYASGEQKAELKQLASAYHDRIAETERKAAKLFEENEAKKAERRAFFAEINAKALRNFLVTAAPFLLTVMLTVIFGTRMFASENGVFMILTIIFAALSLIVLVCTLFTLKRFLDANRSVKLNERDTSTKLGREYLEIKNELELLKRIYFSFSDDIS